MSKPAEMYDSDDSTELYGFSCGDEFTRQQRSDRHAPTVDTSGQVAARLRVEREENTIAIIMEGSLYELEEIHGDPIGIDLSALLLNEWPPLFHAAFGWRLDKLNWLLAHGSDVNQCVGGTTALIAACMSDDSAHDDHDDERLLCGTLRTLLSHGAVLNIGDRLGRTPLMYAARQGYLLVVELMMQENVALEACDNEGDSALFHAIEGNQVEMVKLLLRDVNDKSPADILNGKGVSARSWAETCCLDQLDELFPLKNQFVLRPEFLINNTVAALAPTVFGSADVPPFFFDVREMLVGMRSEQLVQNFAEANVGLLEFLNIDDAQMVHIGVRYPFQRNRVRLLLQRFHERQFSPRALRSLAKRSTTADLFAVIAGHLKHVLIARTSVEFAMDSGYVAASDLCDVPAMLTLLADIRQRIARLRNLVLEMNKVAPPPVQHIGPGGHASAGCGLRGWHKLLITSGLLAIAGTLAVRMYKH